MRFDIMTLFPELVETVLGESIIGRARAAGILDIRTYNIRTYSDDKRHRVDDTPYGGGRGMLMAPPPIWNCYRAVLADGAPEGTVPDDPDLLPPKPANTRVLYMSPRGTTFTQKKAAELASLDRVIILCGHYEGVDERVLEEIVDEEVSIGDYVLTGGEIPACIVTDSISRLVPGVLALPECYENESFQDGLLEYPQYTRPRELAGLEVPEVLLSGDHAKIRAWRRAESLKATLKHRPDLLETAELTAKEKKWLEELKQGEEACSSEN